MARVNEIERILANVDRELEGARKMYHAGDMPENEVQCIAESCRIAHAHAKQILAEIDKLVAAFYEKHNI